MPCDSSYLEPTSRERELKRAAELLVYVRRAMGKTPSDALLKAARDPYGEGLGEDGAIPELCLTLRALGPTERHRIVYNAKLKIARDLADWWEEHQEADRKREATAKAARDKKRLVAQARAKLTPAERRALEVD